MRYIKRVDKESMLLICIIVVQVIYLTCMFAVNKQGFHSDELWNYGFANSTNGAHIFRTDFNHQPKNLDSWQNSQKLLEYISVDRSEIFNYAAVYWNAERDYNPPLGNMMLHFICSLFPGTWSKWYGFALNIICFIIMQIYMYKLVSGITKNKSAGIFGCMFYGFTMGALNITFFLRIYAPATMFAVINMFYAHDLYNNRNTEDKHNKILAKIFITSLLGCLTLHFFLVFAFFVTVMYVMFYLISKNIKLFFKYGVVMAGSVLLSFIMFPETIYHVFLDDGMYSIMMNSYTQYPTLWQYKIYWSFMTNNLFGIHNSIWKTMTLTYCVYAVCMLILILLPVCFVLRKEEKFKEFVKKIKMGICGSVKNLRCIPYTLIVLVVTICALVLIASKQTSIYAMGQYSVRYIFIAYPLLAAFAVSIVYMLVSWCINNVKIKNVICVVLCIVFASLSVIMSPTAFFFKHDEMGKTLTQLENNSNCIVVLSETWLMTCITCEIYNTQNYFATSYTNAFNNNYNSDMIDKSQPLYLILDISRMGDEHGLGMLLEGVNVVSDKEKENSYDKEEYLEFFEHLEIANRCELVGTDEIFSRPIEIYRLN